MNNIPEKIWLNLGEEVSEDADFRDLSEVTWSENKVFDKDVEYVRKSEWINAKERLPEDGEWVIIVVGEDGVQTAVWNETHQCWDDDEGDDVEYEKDVVTMWMSIPEPPTKRGEG